MVYYRRFFVNHCDDTKDAGMKRKFSKILVYLPTYVKTNRDMLKGLLAYMECHSPWDVEVLGTGENYERNADRDFSGFNGAICYADGSKLAENILSNRYPIIVIFPDKPDKRLLAGGKRSYVFCDSRPIGRAGAKFLLDKSAVTFAFIESPAATYWSNERRDAFLEVISKSGKDAVVLNSDQLDRLEKMTGPIGVLAENDRMARSVLTFCRTKNISIPQDVMLLGVDNDDLLCRTANPSLSSISMNGEETGERTAALLDAMMRKPDSATKSITYSFAGFSDRASTADDMTYGELADRVRALIAARLDTPAAGGIKIPELVRQLGISRRTLELDFREKTGRTLHDEIIRQQLRKAMRLLTDGTMPIETIAEECCFSSPSHFGSVFRKQFGYTPSEARKQSER